MNVYTIETILNHNVVKCYLPNDDRKLLAFGKGIGFGSKVGDLIKEENISNIYEIRNIKNLNKYEKLLSVVSDDVLTVSEEIIIDIIKNFGKQYDEKIHISLLDHINFSVNRLKKGIVVENIFGEELQYLYPKEYYFAKEMLKRINEQLNINLPDSEAGFLCMHLHAALSKEDKGYSQLVALIISDCLKILQEELDLKVINKSFARQRLITHLKFAIKRSFENVELNNELAEIIEEKYKSTYEIAKKIAGFIKEKYQIELSKGEQSYLTLHIKNIILDEK